MDNDEEESGVGPVVLGLTLVIIAALVAWAMGGTP